MIHARQLLLYISYLTLYLDQRIFGSPHLRLYVLELTTEIFKKINFHIEIPHFMVYHPYSRTILKRPLPIRTLTLNADRVKILVRLFYELLVIGSWDAMRGRLGAL